MQVNIVSVDKKIYSGTAKMLVATSVNGEIAFLLDHAPYIGLLQPGNIRVKLKDGKEEVFYVSSGIVEVRSNSISVLTDIAERAENLDEARALQAKANAEKSLADKQNKLEYAAVKAELIQAIAQIRTIKKLREKHK